MTIETTHLAFSDPRAFVVPHKQPGPSHPLDSIFVTQGEDGPTTIHVGVTCTDAYSRETWEKRKRFPRVTLEQLQAARDQRVQRSEVQHG